MKKFITIQILLIGITVILCYYAKSLSDDVGISHMDTIENISKSRCDNIAVIYTVDDMYDEFSQFESENADYGLGLFETTIFVGTPQDQFSFSNGSTFCTIDVDKVIKGKIEKRSIDVEIKGGFYYETETDYDERIMDARDMEIDTPQERLFVLDFGGINFMIPGKEYLIIAQTLDFKGKTVYRINGYQISWLCLDETKSELMKKEYVYSDCSTNEFFSPNQTVIDAFYQKKDEILKSYNL